MTEKKLFVKADVSYSDRWLYQSETFRKEKNLNIALPNEREFMTGECIVTDKDDTAYSIDELVNLLNYFNRCTVSNKEFMELKEENERLKQFKEKVFVLLDEKIKHYEHKPFSAPVSNPANPNYDHDVDRLARLSELQELKREFKE